ncbi:hypothetical protein EXIGLDRAFT_374337 [Exidia glandulosa HHB12029]|uniref:Uncharacterized protein n=1 Tax=Exidia glandulosa HHB12029 TaxID=1314781 RepID=A0A165PYK0_EXIGL|nr:hypothetical protein EXIGLDRAFT_374337 [Exidia glandulosa HHB12029]
MSPPHSAPSVESPVPPCCCTACCKRSCPHPPYCEAFSPQRVVAAVPSTVAATLYSDTTCGFGLEAWLADADSHVEYGPEEQRTADDCKDCTDTTSEDRQCAPHSLTDSTNLPPRFCTLTSGYQVVPSVRRLVQAAAYDNVRQRLELATHVQ